MMPKWPPRVREARRVSRTVPLALLFLALGCEERQEILAPPAAEHPKAFDFTSSDPVINGPAHGPTGAIFTTIPDGGKVNENVKYASKLHVYLDGGPRNDNPYAAGLDDGWYVFQVTDPSGKYLLSMDPAKCRVVEVEDGVIQRLVLPSEMGLGLGDTYGNGSNAVHCHDPSTPGTTDVPGSGQHEINPDSDPGGGKVVQLMPFGTTPNPGNEYKAWVTTWGAYKGKVGASALASALDGMPTPVRGKASQPCPDFCAAPDPGFDPPRSLQKTDNFKVLEAPPFIRIAKRTDLTGDGPSGDDPLYTGGWTMTLGEPVFDGTTITNAHVTGPSGYTELIPVSSNTGITVCEEVKSGWAFSYATVDGSTVTPYLDGGGFMCITLNTGTGPNTIEIAFGNFELGSKSGLKFHDLNADGLNNDGAVPSATTIDLLRWDAGAGAYVYLSSTTTSAGTGAYAFTDLAAGQYAVCEVLGTGWVQSAPTAAPTGETLVDCAAIDTKYGAKGFGFVIQSGSTFSGNEFGNYQSVSITGTKLFDADGDGVGSGPLENWQIEISGVTSAGTYGPTVVNTNALGVFTLTDLLPGTYTVCELQQTGFFQTFPTSGFDCASLDAAHGHTHGAFGYQATLSSGDGLVANFDFCNTANCVGRTPGYWSNWRNHYTDAQFLSLLSGTIATSIAEADAYLTSTGCDDEQDALACMRRMLLANQLTMSLTQANANGAGLFNDPSLPANLTGFCEVSDTQFRNETGLDLAGWLEIALAIHAANGSGYTREEILEVKDALDAFANLKQIVYWP